MFILGIGNQKYKVLFLVQFSHFDNSFTFFYIWFTALFSWRKYINANFTVHNVT